MKNIICKYNSQKAIPLCGGAAYLRISEKRLDLFPRRHLEELQFAEPPPACGGGGAPPLLRRRRAAEDGRDHVPRRSRRPAISSAPDAEFIIVFVNSAEIGGGIVYLHNRQPQFEIRRHNLRERERDR